MKIKLVSVIMKKILSIIGILILSAGMIFSLSACGNQRLFDYEWDTYKYIHCLSTNECYEIKSWKNNEIGIKVETKEYGILYFSEGTYILIGEKCPICAHD